MHLDASLDSLARRQHGLVERSQLLGHGISPGAIARWMATGRLVGAFPSVYRLAGAPVTWEQRLLAAVMATGPGSLASHRAAARLWKVAEGDEIEVTVPGCRRRRPPGVVVHRSSDLVGARAIRRGGIATTTPLRMLVDLGAVVTSGELEDALDRALTSRLVTVAGVAAALEEVARSGRRGAGTLRTVLDGRALGAAPADSLLEPRMARLLRAHGLPPAAFQHDVFDAGRFVARVDFAYPDLRIALEVDGLESHSSPRALQADLHRQNALVVLGWTVLRFTWVDVVRRPARVAAEVRRILRSQETA
jgi:very-short-patch-repair endonuclease